MNIKDIKQLDEFKASGQDSEAADAVTPAGGTDMKRSADKKGNAEGKMGTTTATPGQGGSTSDLIDTVTTAKTPARRGDKTVGESVSEIFAGSDLSEDFKEKASVIFETVVNAKIQEEVAALEEEYAAKLDEEVASIAAELTEKVDAYLDYVVDQWMEENQVAIDRGIRAEVAEAFIDGLRDLFIEHAINVPEDEVDVVAEMAEELEFKDESLNEAINETIELRKQLEAYKAKDILESYSKGLTDTQAEKLHTLAEGVEFNDSKEFERKVQIIKEQYFGGKSVLRESRGDNLDPIGLDEETVVTDPQIALYAQALSKTLRKS
jgi:hypothetical protein